jgi:hypothetical protein
MGDVCRYRSIATRWNLTRSQIPGSNVNQMDLFSGTQSKDPVLPRLQKARRLARHQVLVHRVNLRRILLVARAIAVQAVLVWNRLNTCCVH